MRTTDRAAQIATLRQAATQAQAIVEQFPRLRAIATSRLALIAFSTQARETKAAISEQLLLLSDALDNLDNRLNLPVLVGLVGKFSSGKSSLINEFLACIFKDQVPPDLLRPTANTATDVKFTYITHADFVDRFGRTDDIDIAVTEHAVFKAINFIDTPGTGWQQITQKEVSDLLSAADMMLFVSRPFDILEAEAVEALYLKYTRYAKVPMWHVFTFASHYLGPDRSWDELPLAEFRADLTAAKEKLATRPCASEEDARMRDLVAKTVQFEVGRDTFLVDARYHFQTAELFARLRDQFDSPAARAAKLARLDADVQAQRRELVNVLGEAGQHIAQLGETLHAAYSNVIIADALNFQRTTIAGESAFVAERMFARLRSAPFTIQPRYAVPQSLVSVTYAQTPPEVSLLQVRLDNMRRDKMLPAFAYRNVELIFPLRDLNVLFLALRTDLTEELRRSLDAAWQSERAPAPLGLGHRAAPFDLDAARLNAARQELAEYLAVCADRRSQVLNRFHATVLLIADLFAYTDLRKTIFNRQVTLREDMEASIPVGIAAVSETCADLERRAVTYATNTLHGFAETLAQQCQGLQEEATGFLREAAFRPTNEALNFLFGGEGVAAQAADVEVGVTIDCHISAEHAQTIETKVKARVTQARGALQKVENDWQTEREKLREDSELLVKEAQQTAHALRANQEHARMRLDNLLAEGQSAAEAAFAKLHAQLQAPTGEARGLVERVVAEARFKQRAAKILELVVLVVSLFTVVAQLVAAYTQNYDPNTYVWATVVGVPLLLAGFMFSRLMNRRARFAQLLQQIYEARREQMLDEVRRICDESLNALLGRLGKVNTAAAEELTVLYDKCIEDGENAYRALEPKLSAQLGSAADLGRSMTRNIADIENDLVSNVRLAVEDHLEGVTNEVRDELRKHAAKQVRVTAEAYASRLEHYIELYMRLARGLSTLQNELDV